MAPSAATGTKRKKPPTFQHLPEQRAKKLKRDWVDKQKIKSKWKAQKRREGIVTQRDAMASSSKPPDEDPDATAETDAGSLNEEGEEDSDEGGASEGEEESDASSEEEEFHRSDSAFSLSPPRTHPRDQPPPKEVSDDASLRELQRLAYSRSSLHHFKSDPLHRSRGRGGPRGGSDRGGERGRGRGRGRGTDRGRGRGTDRERGRDADRSRGRGADRSRGGGERGHGRGSARGGGQPDMRLRMNALLQKVRKEFEG